MPASLWSFSPSTPPEASLSLQTNFSLSQIYFKTTDKNRGKFLNFELCWSLFPKFDYFSDIIELKWRRKTLFVLRNQLDIGMWRIPWKNFSPRP